MVNNTTAITMKSNNFPLMLTPPSPPTVPEVFFLFSQIPNTFPSRVFPETNKSFGMKKTLLDNFIAVSPRAGHFTSLSFSSSSINGFLVKTGDDVCEAPSEGLSHTWRC